MNLSDVLGSSRNKQDMELNVEWKNALDLYLKTMQTSMYAALQSGAFKKLSTFQAADPEKKALKEHNQAQSDEIQRLKALLVQSEADKASLAQAKASLLAQSRAEKDALLAKSKATSKSLQIEKVKLRRSRDHFKKKAAKLKALVPLQPRKHINNTKRPVQVSRMRAQKYFHCELCAPCFAPTP